MPVAPEKSSKSCPWKYRPAGSFSTARVVLLLLLVLNLLPAGAAHALVHFDFDQKFFVHPHRQVWDFTLVRPDSVYHIFYHTIHEETPHSSYADTIWHATSQDLKHWIIEGPVLTSGQGSWDEGAIWAPDVFYDHTRDEWAMAYTGCDDHMNQRICLASSTDLYSWTKSAGNPALEPDPAVYAWNPDGWWSNFRDPFVFIQDGVFHLLVTAKQNLDEPTGVIYHGVSLDLVNWIDVGNIFVNDGIDPWRVLESPQYRLMKEKYYIFFGEFDTGGISVIVDDYPGNWSMADRDWIDYGYAPEVNEFDKNIPIFSRIAPFDVPATGLRSYVARMDTLQINPDGSVEPYQPNPLAESWKTWSGTCVLAQPTFGDNPAMRGDEPACPVGNGFFGSKEYYQGPLSGRGSPGSMLGDGALGTLESDTFRITGSRMTLLVGGGNYPETCYVALVDAATDTIIYSETGTDQEQMTFRQWDLTPYYARTVFIRIVDQETGPFGHINVDEIHEDNLALSPVGQDLPGPAGLRLRAYPNPFNPRTSIMFDLDREREFTLRIHDLRGRLVWSSDRRQGHPGANSVTWNGLTGEGARAPAGTYLYSLDLDGKVAASGKVCLVK